MINIDLPADLNVEDDSGRNIARRTDATSPERLRPGAVLVVGMPAAWSWARVDDVDEVFVYFRQISARQAAETDSLVAPLRPA